MSDKPFSQASENNKGPILEHLKQYFADASHVLEIGSGTGQHAVHFAQALPHLIWQTSDLAVNHPGINAWLDEANLPNLKAPIQFDVCIRPWPDVPFDGLYSANTSHIMHWPMVVEMFAGAGRRLPEGSNFILYGPFNINGNFTSESNRNFDSSLRSADPGKGLRDLSDIETLALQHGLALAARHDMPANNMLLCFRRLQS